MKNLLILFLTLFISISASYAKDMRFVQVDGTLYSANDSTSEQRLEKIIQDINSLNNVSFVIFSGNNISKPSNVNLLGFIKQAKKLKVPYYVTLGNKDVNKQKHFGKADYVALLNKKVKTHKKILSPNYVFEKNKYIFIVVDGSKEFISNSMGYYRDDVLAWLDEQLTTYADRNIVILQHFPIVPPAQKESRYTHKADKYLELLSKHKNVKAVVAGHFGVNKEGVINNILHISTADAPMYRIIDILDYDSDSPTFWSTIKQ